MIVMAPMSVWGRAALAQAPDSAVVAQFLDLIDQQHYADARQLLAPSLLKLIPPGSLKQFRDRGMVPHGAYRGIKKMQETSRDTIRTIIAVCAFEKGFITMNFALNPGRSLIGFHIIPNRPVHSTRKAAPGDTVIPVPGGKIEGTLRVPDIKGKMPLALIIAGSGPVDRNGNEGSVLRSNTYKQLADSLARHGIASFRYDKRFVGSSNDFTGAPERVTLEDFVSDAAALLRFLKQSDHFSRVFVIGHSEGSLIGILASEQVSPDGYISLEGAGEPLGKIILWQAAQAPDVTGALISKLKILLDTLEAGHLVANPPSPLDRIYNEGVQRFLISDLKYDPSAEIRKLEMPVLIVNGTRDLQVTIDQAKMLGKAKPDARLMIIPDMSHILKNAPPDRAGNFSTYTKPSLPLNAVLVEAIVRFIQLAPSQSHS